MSFYTFASEDGSANQVLTARQDEGAGRLTWCRRAASYLLVDNKLLLAICLGAACTCACCACVMPEVKSQISKSWER